MLRRIALALTLLGAATGAQAQPAFDIAITVDDLPDHGPLPRGMTREGIARSYIATLKQHGVGEAFGFVNAVGMEHEPDSAAVLDLWRQAGYPLGNHTYSHMNLDSAASLADWQADVTRGETAVAAHMPAGDRHWLRFPNLSAGKDPQRHDAVAAWLKARGYHIADVSLSFDDWSYTDAYARCLAQGNDGVIAAMKAQYLQAVDRGIMWMKATSMATYGRIIPQVLLTHIGGWSAMMLPEVMDRLDAAGARYVPLARAEVDPAYAQADSLPGGGGIMERFARARGIAVPMKPAAPPLVDLPTVCR